MDFVAPVETIVYLPVARSHTKTSWTSLQSPTPTRARSSDVKTTYAPLLLTEGSKLAPTLPGLPPPSVTRTVVPACRSRRKMSRAFFSTPFTIGLRSGWKLVAHDTKAT